MTPVVLLLFLAPLLSCCRAEVKPVDCSDVFKENPSSASGVYSIYPFSERFSVQLGDKTEKTVKSGHMTLAMIFLKNTSSLGHVYCDRETDGGGWTVFQRRMDGTVNFYRGWDQYVAGFGDADGEHWLGLDFIHKITAKRPQELLVKMEDFEGNKASARYSSFSVGGECDGYKLTVSGFTDGGAGDSLRVHNNMKFSTFDNDQDIWPENCAQSFLGAFWYSNCHDSNANSVYLWGAHPPLYAIGVIWETWKGNDYSLKSIRFQTRPLNCCSNQTFS